VYCSQPYPRSRRGQEPDRSGTNRRDPNAGRPPGLRRKSGKLSSIVDRLADFDDMQSAFFLLRVSFTIVRATHFMRTTPLSKWKRQAEKFDELIRSAAEAILGVPFTDQCYRQACLTPRLGGLGLRRTVDHADIAFSASWFEARSTCEEPWKERDDLVTVASQKIGSFEKDKEILQSLITEAPTNASASAFAAFKVITLALGLAQCPRPLMVRTQSCDRATFKSQFLFD
jgi:hypothetical protein